MAKSLAVSWKAGPEILNDGETKYTPVGASNVESGGAAAGNDRPLRLSGTMGHLFVTVLTNTILAASTVTLQDSQSDTSVTVSIAAETTGDFEDTSNTHTLVAADEVLLKMVGGAGGTSLGIQLNSIEFDSDADLVTLIGCLSSGETLLGASATTFVPAIGGRVENATESTREYTIGEGNVTWADLSLGLAINTRSDTSVARVRIDQTDGNQIISVLAAATGTHEDTSNTDTISANQEINWDLSTGAGTGDIRFGVLWGNLISTDSQWFTCIHGNDQRVLDNVTAWWPIRGSMSAEKFTETETDVAAASDFTSEELIANVSRMVGSVTVTISFRINAADGNQSVELTGVSIVTDTSNTDAVVAGDDINFQTTSPAGGTNYDVQYIGMIGLIAAAAAATSFPPWVPPITHLLAR